MKSENNWGFKMNSRIFLSLGSNLGDRKEYIQKALEEIEKISPILKKSSLRETRAWGKTNQPNFLNMVLEVAFSQSSLSFPKNAEFFLKELQKIENNLGRLRTEKWGARTIDIDILFWGEKICQTKTLTIPHPHWKDRDFVLLPLKEIAEDFTTTAWHLHN